MKPDIVIEMVSDLVCPWCWLGLRRLQSALALLPELSVQTLFRPYQLDPTIPQDGLDYRAYMRTKFGSRHENPEQKNRWHVMREALETYGEAEGIPFAFEGIKRQPNTINAHRLVHWAQGQEKGWAAKEALFQAYFTEHRDIGTDEVLTDIAARIGLDPGLVGDLLAGEADRAYIDETCAYFKSIGLKGVPSFILNRRGIIQGAEASETMAKMIADMVQTA